MNGFLEERAGLSGRVAVVAGGGGGLGRAIALDLAAAGMRLAICDIDAGALADTVPEVQRRQEGSHEPPFSMILDVREPDALAAFFSGVDEHFGHIDALVNVVGGTFHAPFVDTRRRGWEALVRANFLWLLDATHTAATRMAAGGGGSIVNLTSIEAHRAAPGYAVYAALKAAVTHLTGTLAVELGPARIRVNCIACDYVPTEGLATLTSRTRGTGGNRGLADNGGADDDEGALADALSLPLGRKATPEDVGNAALFLVSDLAASITGTTLHPDGGALAASGWLNWPGAGWQARPAPGTLVGTHRDQASPLRGTPIREAEAPSTR